MARLHRSESRVGVDRSVLGNTRASADIKVGDDDDDGSREHCVGRSSGSAKDPDARSGEEDLIEGIEHAWGE